MKELTIDKEILRIWIKSIASDLEMKIDKTGIDYLLDSVNYNTHLKDIQSTLNDDFFLCSCCNFYKPNRAGYSISDGDDFIDWIGFDYCTDCQECME